MRKLLIGSLVTVAVISPFFASGQSLSDLQLQIQTLLARIAMLQAQIQQVPTTPTPIPDTDDPVSSYGGQCPSLTRILDRGMRDSATNGEVSELQFFLANHFGVSESDLVTGFYGSATAQYVQRFQRAQGIVDSGRLGPNTRAAIARVCGITTQPQVPVTPTRCPEGTVLQFGQCVTTTSAVSCSYRSNTGTTNVIATEWNTSGKRCVEMCTIIRNEKLGAADSGTCVYTSNSGTETTAIRPGTQPPQCLPGYTSAPGGCVPNPSSATIDQNGTTMAVGNVAISGTAQGAAAVIVTLISNDPGRPYTWNTDWASVGSVLRGSTTGMTEGENRFYSHTVAVTGERRYSATFANIPSGAYIVLIHKSDYQGYPLLARGTVVVSGDATNTFPGLTMTVTPDNAHSFTAWFKLGQWTDYTYELDWGEGDPSYQTNCSRVVTVCSSRWNCSAPAGSFHIYQQTGEFPVVLYAVKMLPNGERNRTVAARASVRVSELTNNGSIKVTAPNGGEQWEVGQLNTITWAPYGYNPNVNAPNEINVFLERADGTTVGQIMDTGKASLHTYFNIADYNTWAQPGQYRVYVHNRVTGATDRSDGLFTLLPRPVDLKVNGSDGPVTLSQGEVVSLSWNSPTGSSCTVSGVRDVNSVNSTGTTVGQTGIGSLPASSSGYRAAFIGAQYAGSIYMTCDLSDGRQRSDAVGVNAGAERASIQVISPNGGETLDMNSGHTITWNQTGLTDLSVALYRNDQWYAWISKGEGLTSARNSVGWYPSTYVREQTAESIWKIYMTGRKADGTGYVDDKSDAPFALTNRRTSISMSHPQHDSSHPEGAQLPFRFTVTDAPPRSLVELEIQKVTPKGDIEEIWRWQSGELAPNASIQFTANQDAWTPMQPGFPSSQRALPPGTYQAFAFVIQCHPQGCATPRLAPGRGDSAQYASMDRSPTVFTIGSSAFNTYRGYMNGNLFITTQNITEAAALENCQLNARNNPTSSVRCTWGDKEIYNRPVTQNTSCSYQPTTGRVSTINIEGGQDACVAWCTSQAAEENVGFLCTYAGQKVAGRDIASSREVQVVGVYEGALPGGASRGFRQHPEGTVNVRITGTTNTPPVLVLSSYEPVHWVIQNDANATFEKVVTLGYYDQRVSGLPQGTPVEPHTLAADGNYAWSCAYANYETNGGCSYGALNTWLTARGMPITTFTGSYGGSSFTVYLGAKGQTTSSQANFASVLLAAELLLKKLLESPDSFPHASATAGKELLE